jgi:oligopeptide transport system ATP-binding protein
MRRGALLEKGHAAEVLLRPQHPYTRGLMKAVPRLALDAEARAVPRSERRLVEFTG